MPTPLESFMEALQKRRKCEESIKRKHFAHTSEIFSSPEASIKCEFALPDSQDGTSVSSLRTHTHTLRGFASPDAEMKCETKCERSLTLRDQLQVGMVVEWDSPLFGLLRGVALEVTPHAVTVFHPLTEIEVPIPKTWLRVTTQ